MCSEQKHGIIVGGNLIISLNTSAQCDLKIYIKYALDRFWVTTFREGCILSYITLLQNAISVDNIF